jgi:GTPase SAR1 family protein
MKINLQLWDMGGQPRFQPFTDMYVNGSSAVFYFIDSTRINRSMNHYEEIKNFITNYISNEKIFYVATKTDLEESDPDGIRDLEAELENNKFFKISSKNGEGVSELQDHMIKYAKQDGNHSGTENNIVSKYFLTGIGGSGKTTFINRLLTGIFSEKTNLTIGPEFRVYSIDLVDNPNEV